MRSVVLASPDAAFRSRLRQQLEGMRWQVREAGGGAEALAQLDASAAEALVLDTHLPDLEVTEFAHQIRRMHPEMDLLRMDGAAEDGAPRSPRRNELLHALRQAQETSGPALAPPSGKGGASYPVLHSIATERYRPNDERAQAAQEVAALLRSRDARRQSVPAQQRNGSPVGGTALDAANGAAPGTAHDPARETFGDMAQGTAQNIAQNAIPESVKDTLPDKARTARKQPAAFASAEPPDIVPAAPRRQVAPLPGVVGESAAMTELAHMVRLVSARSSTVLIQGDTGTGKELIAQAVHRLSPRSARPFVVLNCAAIPESLLEAELFGHTRGAFTGAVQSRSGRIEAAHTGTLFLDEIGEMPLALQAKMLRFLESGELQRVGENEMTRVDVRVVAASHQPLKQRAAEHTFRLDLYHRLSVFPVQVPALKDRTEDIPLLAEAILQRMGAELPVKRLSHAAAAKLLRYDWPGNVRELAHVLERGSILAEDRPEIAESEIRF